MKALRLHLAKVDKVFSELQSQLADVIHRLECGEDLDEEWFDEAGTILS